MPLHLMLRFKAPIASFGVVSGEEIRRTGDFPVRSMVLGLLGNALGLNRCEARDMARLDALQLRTRFAAVLVSAGTVWIDVQNARTPDGLEDPSVRIARGGRLTDDPCLFLGKSGQRERLEKFLTKPVQRTKEYLTGAHALVGLSPIDAWPEDPADLAAALRHPARPLWIGRKACPPSAPVFLVTNPVEASNGLSALVASFDDLLEREPVSSSTELPVLWEGVPEPGARVGAWRLEGGFATRVLDRRSWVSNRHEGGSVLRRGVLRRVEVADAA